MTPAHLRDPALDPILAAIKDRGVTHLDIVHRCRLMDRIINSVTERIKQYKLYQSDSGGKQATADFRPFTSEDDALAAIVSTLEWSDRFRDFFNDNARKFGQVMSAKEKFSTFHRKWDKANETDRLNILKSMALAQLELFRHDGLTPVAPAITCLNHRPNAAGAFAKGAWGLSLNVQDKTVYINTDLIKSGMTIDICETIWHEHVHSLCQQFAASCKAGILHQANPFYADAKLKQARLETLTAVDSRFPKAYAADPEEKLAYKTEKVFIDSWLHHSR